MFLALSTKDTWAVYNALPKGPVVEAGRMYVGFDRQLVSCPEYFYGFSHVAADRVTLPDETFTISCFRDPVNRVIALYSQYKHYLNEDVAHPCRKFSDQWVRDGFGSFLRTANPSFVSNQLHMFSRAGSIQEAVDRASAVNFVFRTEALGESCKILGAMLNLPLSPLHLRRHSHRVEVSEQDRSRAREVLDKEYRMLSELLGAREWRHSP